MPDQTIERSKNFDCEYAEVNVDFKWSEITIMDGNDPKWTKLGTRGCTGVGTGNCPVTGKRGQRDWPKCPHLPKL